jgi:hypothetical protein
MQDAPLSHTTGSHQSKSSLADPPVLLDLTLRHGWHDEGGKGKHMAEGIHGEGELQPVIGPTWEQDALNGPTVL